MKQEDKNLLLQDLCGRLPYGVKVSVNQSQLQNYDSKWKNWSFEEEPEEIDSVSIYGVTFGCMDMSDGVIGFEFIKPYLFPLSSMTGEQTKEVHSLIYQGISESVDETKEWLKTRKENNLRPITLTYILSYKLVIDWFCKNHFDYRGLIEKGLAIDCTNLNIY